MCAQAAGTKAPAGASTDAKEVGHPLCGFVPTIVDSFEEWVKEWRSTTHLYARLGLVHSLASESWWARNPEMVSFLLGVADG